MKKQLLLILLLFCFTVAKGYKVLNLVTGDIEDAAKIPTYEVRCDTIDSGFRLTYTFSGLALSERFDSTEAYGCNIEGFGYNMIPGLPEVPVKNDRILMPYRTSYSIKNLSFNFKTYDLHIVDAKELLMSDGSFDSGSGIKDDAKNGLFPENFVVLNDIQIYRGNYFQYYTVYPVLYDSVKGKTNIASRISFELLENEDNGLMTLSEDEETPRLPISISGANAVNVSNFSDKYTGLKDKREGYLIITTDSLLSSAKELAEWKKMLGYEVNLQYKPEWQEDEVFETVKTWNDENEKAKYLLIIGDRSFIPMRTGYPIMDTPGCQVPVQPNDTTYILGKQSDFYYSCLDGEYDYESDLIWGRIPASFKEEADAAIRKIIAYEKNPNPTNGMSSFAAVSYFETGVTDKEYEHQNSFVFNTENVINSIGSAFGRTKRVYYCEEKVNPLYWNNGTSLPDYLKKPLFNWNTNSADVRNLFEANTNLIFFNTHGQTDRLLYPETSILDLCFLKNTTYPIIFSPACSTGNFLQDGCLASHLLFLDKGGCSSILAPTANSYVDFSELMMVEICNAIWPSLNLAQSKDMDYSKPDWTPNESYSSSFGECLIEANKKLHSIGGSPVGNSNIRDQLEIFAILGDPSLHCFWDTQTDVASKTSLLYDEFEILVKTKDKPAIITFYDKVTGNHDRRFSNDASFETSTPENVFISISMAGATPLMGWYDDIINTIGSDFYVKSCEYGKGQLRIEYEDYSLKIGQLNIDVFKINGSQPTSLIQSKLLSSPAVFDLPRLNNGDMFCVSIRKNTEIVYIKKILVK